MKKALLMTALGLLLTSSVLASPKQNEQVAAKKEIKQDIKETHSTEKAIKQLNHEINLWHDANLKGDKALINQFQVLIFDHLEKDILATVKQIEAYEIESDVKQANSLLKAKKQILKSLRRSRSFSNRYRLLGDYAALLKKELKLGKMELAEDIREHRAH